MPPMEPPMATATDLTPRWSSTSLCNLSDARKYNHENEMDDVVTYRTSSLMVVRGKSGPYGLPVSGLMDMGDAVPYGEPITLPQKIK